MSTSQEKIIDAAKELFAQKGYFAVRTKEIAAKAGVNETTLFRNFKSKRELYEKVLMSNIMTIDTDNVFHQNLTGDVKVDLLSVTYQLFMIYKSNSQIIKMVMHGIIQDSTSLNDYSNECRSNHIKKHLISYFEDLVKKNIIDDDPKLIAELYMNCMNGYLLSTFVLEEREAQLDILNKMTKKIINTINFV